MGNEYHSFSPKLKWNSAISDLFCSQSILMACSSLCDMVSEVLICRNISLGYGIDHFTPSPSAAMNIPILLVLLPGKLTGST